MIANVKGATLINMDCVAALKKFKDGRFDSVVTDPPYELGFMGKSWDASGIAYSVALWREVLRVLKPGGYLLAFGSSRTHHRIMTAIEDAGFEIRDTLTWHFGTGFPKSLNVAKAIEAGGGPEAIRRLQMGEGYEPSGRGRVNYDHGGGSAMNGQTGQVPLSPEAARWEGWGTALKPATEFIAMARKPLVGTVAANVAAHGTGALNVDGCRIATDEDRSRPGTVSKGGILNVQPGGCVRVSESHPAGRWPANVLLDESAAAELDAQSGHLAGRGNKGPSTSKGGTRSVALAGPTTDRSNGPEYNHDAGGGASRFFYVAKPSRKERDLGCEALPVRSGGEATDREDGSAGVDNPRAGAGRTGGKKAEELTVEVLWDNEVRKAVLRVATGTSQPKVIGVSGALSTDASVWNTILFGKGPTALSRLDTTSTIATKTSSTTESKTWNWFRGSFTSAFTETALSTQTVDGISPAESADAFGLLTTITAEQTASLLGAAPAASRTLLRIRGSGTLVAEGIRNHHCTVKPIALMRWLVRLVTPPGGVVLDPFLGSGTTGIAALQEGFQFIGTEREPEYFEIAKLRCEAA